MAVPRWLKLIFAHYGVAYEEHHHPPVATAQELAEVEHVSGYRVAKAVYLDDHGHPLAVVLPACARLDLERTRRVAGNPNLCLATEAQIAGWFKGCQPGSVPPVRLRSDERIFMDRSLAHLDRILLPAGTPEDAVVVRFRDWYRAVRPGVGHFIETANGHAPARPTVLVIEDEPVTNTLLCEVLNNEGYACHGAEDGQHALDLAARIHPDAILLDLMLPDLNGFEVYERIRRTGPLKRVPVVVVSALDDEASRKRGRELGIDAYLTKPFMPDTLVSELHEVLEPA